MHLVKIGFYTWVAGNGLMTTSLAHAYRFETEAEAQTAAQWVRDNFEAAVAGLPESPRTLRAHYLEKRPPVEVVPLEGQRELVYDIDEQGNHVDPPDYNAVPANGAAPKRTRYRAPPAAPPADGAAKQPGITRQVYQWCLDNPAATKADALAAWPSANPSTVGVQFGAARKASATRA